MLLRTLVTITLILPAFANACEDYSLPDEQQQYLKELALPYQVPSGSTGVKVQKSRSLPGDTQGCTVVDDFNGDGRDDFAGIFQYTGERKRLDDWSLDIVILFSEAAETRHVIFPFSGQFNQRDQLLYHYLRQQPPGEFDLRPGRVKLEHPSILSYRRGKPAVVYFWDGGKITQRAIGIDD